jgi:hypothetical protein
VMSVCGRGEMNERARDKCVYMSSDFTSMARIQKVELLLPRWEAHRRRGQMHACRNPSRVLERCVGTWDEAFLERRLARVIVCGRSSTLSSSAT